MHPRKGGIAPQQSLTSELHQAALEGNLDSVVKLKLEQEDNFKRMLVMPDHNNNLPLDRAAPRGHYQIVKTLIEAHKENGLEYHIHNTQNYTPFLSAVRWYCKVLDGTYAKDVVHGNFNTGANKNRDYLQIIRLLMESYPEHPKLSDNKSLTALHYVIIHLSNEVEKKSPNRKIIDSLKQLLTLLLEQGMSLDRNDGAGSPRDYARKRDLLPAIEQIERIAKPLLSTSNKKEKANTSEKKIGRNKKQTEKKPYEEYSFEIVAQIEPVQNLKKEAQTFQAPTSIKQRSGKHNDIKNPNDSTIVANIKKDIKEDIKENNNKVRVKQNATTNQSSLFQEKEKRINCSELAKEIYEVCKKNNSSEAKLSVLNKHKDYILTELNRLLSESNASFQNVDKEGKVELISKLSNAIKVPHETTGSWCCQKDKYFLEFDDKLFKETFLKNHNHKNSL